MYKTLTAITQGVITKIGLVNGTAVQTYTEPQIKAAVQDAVYMIFRKRYWAHLSDWYTFPLDGTLGVVTADLTNIVKTFEDIREVYRAGTENRLSRPVGLEHTLINQSSPMYFTPLKFTDPNFTTRVLQFWPKQAVGSVTFYARTCPDNLIDSDLVPFQADMMEWAAAWLILETDGLNPGNANKANSMFQVAYNDIVASMNDDVIGFGGRGTGYVNPVW